MSNTYTAVICLVYYPLQKTNKSSDKFDKYIRWRTNIARINGHKPIYPIAYFVWYKANENINISITGPLVQLNPIFWWLKKIS